MLKEYPLDRVFTLIEPGPVLLVATAEGRKKNVMTMANHPRLLLADEPTAALDSAMGRKVMELLKEAARKHDAGVLVVTHDHRAIDVFDRIWVMEDGRIGKEK